MATKHDTQPLLSDQPATRKPRTLRRDFFHAIDSPTKAWLIGFLATDGTVSNRCLGIALRRRDRPMLERIREVLGSDAVIGDYLAKCDGKAYPASRVSFYSAELVADLASYGIVPNKTEALTFWSAPEIYARDYARGLIDGDGSIYFSADRKWHLSFYGTQSVASGLAIYLEKCTGITPSAIYPKGKGWEFKYWRQTELQPIMRLLYDGSAIALSSKQIAADKIVASEFREYHDWSNSTLEQIETDIARFPSIADYANSLGLRRAQVANRMNRLRRLARGIKC